MSELDAIAEIDPAWAADVARDQALSNEQLAREVADLAADGRPIYGTLLGLLNRLRPQTPPADLGSIARARSLTSLDVETLKTAIARTIIGHLIKRDGALVVVQEAEPAPELPDAPGAELDQAPEAVAARAAKEKKRQTDNRIIAVNPNYAFEA